MRKLIKMEGTRTLCLCCGESWPIAEVKEDTGGRFTRRGSALAACPGCGGTRPETLTPGCLRMLKDFGGFAAACGDDIDKFAFVLEVFKRE